MEDDLRQQYFEQLQDYMLGSKDRELNPYVSKDKLKEVLWKLDPEQRMDADVEGIMVDLVGEFVETVSKQAAMLAKHRKGEMVEAVDAQLISEKNYNIRVPGFGLDPPALSLMMEKKNKRLRSETHQAKVTVVREQARKAGVQKRNARIKAKAK